MEQESNLPKGIGQPATRALTGAGIFHLEQLTGYSEAQILRLHGVGPKAIRLLRSALEEKGLMFAREERTA